MARFRGRQIRLRYLFTSIKVSDVTTISAAFMWNLPDDDGEYIDNVRVTQTLGTASATASVDSADNSTLPNCVCGGASACDDANPCTTDACDSQAGCVHTSTPSEVLAVRFTMPPPD